MLHYMSNFELGGATIEPMFTWIFCKNPSLEDRFKFFGLNKCWGVIVITQMGNLRNKCMIATQREARRLERTTQEVELKRKVERL
jgi:hypothetical protein